MAIEGKTILITGGAGFIGSHLCRKYLAEGHRVIALDNLQTTQTPKHIEELFGNERFRFIKHDVIEPIRINGSIDWIFNLACSGSYTSYQYDPVHTLKTNTVGMINVLELAKEKGARVLQASTSEIYGDPEVVPQPESYRGSVNPLGPRACYDEGKRAAETLCMDYHREHGVDVRIVRIFNTYGSRMDENDGRAVTNFILRALANEDIVIYGDGSNTRSFQYIDDLVEGMDRMMRKDGFIGPVNLGNPGEVSMRAFAEEIIALTGSRSSITYDLAATDDPKRRCPDITLAKRELDWEPRVARKEGLQKTIEYFKTVPRPDRDVLVFATTFGVDGGPAEAALEELCAQMPETTFHVVTSRFSRTSAPAEHHSANVHVYRVGFGSSVDKFLLPILGFRRARALDRKHDFRFAWSVMASYGAAALWLFKRSRPEVTALVTLDDREHEKRLPILNSVAEFLLGRMDSVHVSESAAEQTRELARRAPHATLHDTDGKAFANRVRYSYLELLSKRQRKLPRAK